MVGQDQLRHDGRQGALHLLVAVPTALVFLAPGAEVGT